MNLSERNGQLAALEDLLSGSQRARNRTAMISGGIGTGKTALLRAFAERATGSGALYLGAVASRVENDLPFGVLEQLFRGPDLPPAAAESAMRWLDAGAQDTSAAGPQDGGGAAQMSSPVLRRLWAVVHDLAEHQPVVIGVDDAHHADEPSLRCLLYLLRRLRPGRLHVIFTESAHLSAANALLHNEVMRDPGIRRIRLRPLSEAGVAEMLAARLGEREAQGLAPGFHRSSAGYPALVEALIDDHRGDPGDVPGGLVAGEAYGRAVLNLLYRHEPTVMEVAHAAAVLGGHASETLLGRLAGIDTGSAAQALNMLADAGIWADGRFRHDAFPAAVLDGTEATAGRAAHGRAAELLNNEGVAATEVAAHIVAADRVDAPWVIPILREAAEQALANDDVPLSLRYLRAAYQMCDDERQRPAIVSALADAEWRVDPATVLRHLHEIDPARDLAPDGGGDLSPVTYLLWHGRVAEAWNLLDRSPRGPGGGPAAVDHVTPRLWAAYLYPGPFGDRDAARSEPMARSAANPELQGAAMLTAELAHGNGIDVVDTAVGLLQRSRLNHRTFTSLAAALAVLTYNDRLDRAAVWCDSLLEEAVARRSPTWHALFSGQRALISARQGDLVAAERHVDVAFRVIPATSWGVAVGLPLAAMVLATTAAGDVGGAATFLDVPVPEEMFQTRMGLHYLYARGRHHLEAGRPHAAMADFRACGRLMASWGIDLPAVEPWRTGAAQARLLLGQPVVARRLIDEQLALLAPVHQRTRGISLRLRAATHDAGSRQSALREAVAVLEECGDRLELAYALADLSRACEADGDDEQARAQARKARALAHECGADLALEVEAPDRDPEPGRVTELSDAERRVAALAAEGHTNRQISERLDITISTVEQHLTRIYRKLNVRRLDLSPSFGTAMRSPGGTPAPCDAKTRESG